MRQRKGACQLSNIPFATGSDCGNLEANGGSDGLRIA